MYVFTCGNRIFPPKKLLEKQIQMSHDTIFSQGTYLLSEKLIKIKTNKCKQQPAMNSRCELRADTISFITDSDHLSYLSIN